MMHDAAVIGAEDNVLPFDPLRGQPCRVLHVLDPGSAGGLETVVHALARGHADAGHRVIVAAVSDSEASYRFLDRFSGTRVRQECLAVRGRGYGRERAALAAVMRRHVPDVVHTHGARADVIDAGAARALGVPVVTTVHGFTDATLRTRAYRVAQCAALHRFDAVVAVSGALAHRLAPYVAGSRLHVIPNGYMPEGCPADRRIARSRVAVHDERFLIGWVGRLTPEKAPEVALRGFARLSEVASRVGLELAFMGDGPERSRLERLARELNVSDSVRFHGLRADAPLLMSAFDVLILSSRTEGTPMVLLEAMAARTPIIATRVGGVPEMLTGRDALLVPPGDPKLVASALLNVLLNPEAAASRAERAAGVLADRYDGALWLERYTDLYRRLRLATSRR